MKPVYKYFEHIGNVEFRKYKTSTKMKIIVKSNASVKVTLPYRADYKEAVTFVNEKKEWLIESLKKFKEKQKSTLITSDEIKNITKHHDLFLRKNQRSNFYISVKNKQIVVSYPENLNITDINLQKAINKGIELALKIEAVEYIYPRLKTLSEKTGLKYNGLKINTAKSKWGSCTGTNVINISANIMRLPEHLIDYVLLHELAHIREKNHGKNFWLFLDQLTGNAKLLDKELKNYKIPKF